MRPIASTAVASMQKIAAPDSASELICVKCQSLASPSSDEYWHIGATMTRLGSVRPRSVIGENRALIWGIRMGRRIGYWHTRGSGDDVQLAAMQLSPSPGGGGS